MFSRRRAAPALLHRSPGLTCAIVTMMVALAGGVAEAVTGGAAVLPPHAIVAYHDSWNELPATSAEQSSLASLPAYITVVNLAFARPDLVYEGDLDLSRTGLEYRYSGRILLDSIALLKSRHPGTRVLLSVGGSAYENWAHFDEAAAARLVHDLGVDGIDLDFEPRDPGCIAGPDQLIRCRTDWAWSNLVARIRAVLPRPFVLTAAVWSVGAYGEDEFRGAQPGGRYTGLMLRFLRSPQAAQLDMLSIDAYDAGARFDPLQAFQAYRSVWPGMLSLGLAVQRTGGSGPFYTASEASELAHAVARDARGGMMLYPLLAVPEGPGSTSRPDGRALALAMCLGMDLSDCTTSER